MSMAAVAVALAGALHLARAGENLAAPEQARATGMAFTDIMAEVGTSDPSLTWHGYHDTIVCADWDNDGDVDILVVVSPHNKGPHAASARMFVNRLTETGKLRFEDRTDEVMPGGINKKCYADTLPYFVDLDADGDLDIASVSDEARPTTFRNDGKGVFSLEDWGFSASWLAVKDLNGDGALAQVQQLGA